MDRTDQDRAELQRERARYIWWLVGASCGWQAGRGWFPTWWLLAIAVVAVGLLATTRRPTA